jgi:hypothetical protein
LSASDLLKNYLFQIASLDQGDMLQQVEEKWRKLVNIIGSEDLVDFIRYYWNSRNKIARKVDLYREIKKIYNTPKSINKLINELVASSEIFAALNNPSDEYWNNNEKITEKLQTLKVFALRQPYVLLLIGKEVLTLKQFEKLLTYCIAFTFRYNVICNYSINDQELFYNDLAQKIAKNKDFSEKDFDKLYPQNDVFEPIFKKRSFSYNTYHTKIVKYILVSIEKNMGNRLLPLFSQDITIEHILPQSFSSVHQISEEDHQRLYTRLGNITLLNKSDQKKASNFQFEKKIGVYKRSEFSVTKSIVGTSKNGWDEEMIDQRQNLLSKRACHIWNIPQS